MGQTSVLIPDRLHEQIQTVLLSHDPDCSPIMELLQHNAKLTAEVARRVMYEVVAQINAALFPAVTKLELIHTEGCNLACEYCFEKEMLGYRRMPTEIGQRAIDLLFDYSKESREVSITHFGGEPIVNFPAIREITEYTEQKAKLLGKTATFGMTSNGVLIDNEKAEYFSEHKINVLLSIDGLKESHDRYRVDKRGRGTFDQVMAGLRILKNTQQWVGAKMTVMPENAPNLFKDVLGLYELGVNQFVIGYATGVKWSEQDMRTYVEQWSRLLQWYKEKPRNDFRMTEFEDLDKNGDAPVFACQAGNNTITVSVNGEISPCSKVLALNNKKLMMKLGNVWDGLTYLRSRFELTRSTNLIGACEKAGIANSYQGGCWATNYTDNQDLCMPSMQDHVFKILQKSACTGCSSCK